MRLTTNFGGLGRRLTMLAAASVLALGLGGCAMFDDSDSDGGAGSPFTQALNKDYADLASQAASLPTDAAPESSFWDTLNPFADTPASSSDLLSKAFTTKADLAAGGSEPEPEAAPDASANALRARLIQAVGAGKDQYPEQAARAQADYDCWVLYGTVPSAAAAAQACKTSLDSSLLKLEAASHPIPAPVATAPTPAPVTTAPVAAPSSDFTVYFDFDSWTLKAEQLKVLDAVIATARSGGQANINIVGHTDTSGSADYNQRLSVKRANVVVEALVTMGARRAALHASGVGETDLAVQTPDGVKEAKNRRTVITLQP